MDWRLFNTLILISLYVQPRAGGLTALPENEVGSGNQEAGGAGAGNEDPGVNSDEEEEQEVREENIIDVYQ